MSCGHSSQLKLDGCQPASLAIDPACSARRGVNRLRIINISAGGFSDQLARRARPVIHVTRRARYFARKYIDGIDGSERDNGNYRELREPLYWHLSSFFQMTEVGADNLIAAIESMTNSTHEHASPRALNSL